MENTALPEYQAPAVTTYTDEEILEELGEAHAYTPEPPPPPPP